MALGPAPTAMVDEAALQDAEAMAQALGITVEEALSRGQLEPSIGELGARLEQEQADTFAGLWIQHEPNYRVVVAFTRDGVQTIRPYVAGTPLEGLIEVRAAEVTLGALRREQAEAQRLMSKLGLTTGSGINVQANRVELNVTDQARFDAALQAAGAQLPAHVVVVTIYEPLGTPSFPITPDASVYFPQLVSRSPAFMAALMEGTLVVQDGCLRVVGPDGSGPLVIWQPDYFLTNRDGTLEVLNRDGVAVARAGEVVRMGGGQVPAGSFERDLREPLRPACGGPYWLMGEIETLEAQAVPDIWVDPFQAVGVAGVYLSQSRPAPNEDVLEGTLTLDEQGCLRVGEYAVLWPPDVYWREAPNLHFVQAGAEGEQTVAVLGEVVRLRGAEREAGDYRYFENKVRCQGPYWGAARVEPRP